MPRLFFLLLVLALDIGPAMAQEWTDYRPPGGGYRIEFPGRPALSTRDVTTQAAIIQLNIAMVERGDEAAFLAIHSLRSPRWIGLDPQQALDQARDGAVKNSEGKLREETRVTLGGLPAPTVSTRLSSWSRPGRRLPPTSSAS